MKNKDYCVKAAFSAIGKAAGVRRRRHGAGGIIIGKPSASAECNCSFCIRQRQKKQQQQQQFWNNRTKDLKNINAEYDKRIQILPYEKTVRLLKLMDKS